MAGNVKRVQPCDIVPDNRFVLVFDEKADRAQLADYSSHCQHFEIIGMGNENNAATIDEMENEEGNSSGSEGNAGDKD